MIVTQKQLFFRKIYLKSLLLLTSLILFIISYSLTGKLVSLVPEDINNDYSYRPLIVEKGDTIWSLAAESGLEQDTRLLVHQIIKENSLKDSIIRPGQIIYIPTEAKHHTKPEPKHTKTELISLKDYP